MIEVFDHLMEFVKPKLPDGGPIIGLLRQCEVRVRCKMPLQIFHSFSLTLM